jgi:hypothetical protein
MTAPPMTSPVILEALQPIYTALVAAGLRVFLDPKEVNPPCVYLAPPTMRFRFRQGDYECDQTLLLCSGNTVQRAQYEELSDLLARSQSALGYRMVTARPADMWTADQTAVLAAYEMTWTDTIKHR